VLGGGAYGKGEEGVKKQLEVGWAEDGGKQGERDARMQWKPVIGF